MIKITIITKSEKERLENESLKRFRRYKECLEEKGVKKHDDRKTV